MNYNVDKSLSWNGLYQYSSESGTQYLVKISESAPGSDFWTMDFVKLSGEPTPSEVFKIMSTLFEVSMEYVIQKNITKAFLIINGKDKEEIEKKTNIFVRWLRDHWDYQIVNNPEFTTPKGNQVVLQTNGIYITKKLVTNTESNNNLTDVTIKFCYNCGTENKGFQFCPNCGTNLKQN
jgi:hypothetical protein